MALKPRILLRGTKLTVSCCRQVHVFERTNMSAKGAAVLVGVNGLLALEAIDKALLQGLLDKSIKLEGSGKQTLAVWLAG